MRALVVAVMICSAPAAAETINVKVTDVAGGVAFVTPGRAAGVQIGTKLRIRGRTFTVFEVTEKTAAIKTDQLAIGDSGSASIKRARSGTAKALDKPRAPEAFVGQWPEPVLPSEVQQPKSVPLGAGRPPGRTHVTLIGHAFAGIGKADAAASVETRAIASYDVLESRPLAADLDIALRLYTRGFDRNTRTPVFLRAAQLRYGDPRDPSFAVGRLRFASSTVGMLDGVRAATRVGSLELSAFGGLAPDPTSGHPTADSRFGAEVAYDDVKSSWQPRVALSAQGSTYDGKLDERRLAVLASAGADAIWLDGWAEAQSFPSGNPWGSRAVELVGAGASVQWRKRGRYVAADATFLRPERSLRLAAILPAEWLCTRAPQPSNAAEACASGDYWVAATGSTGIRTKRYALDAIGSFGRSHGYYRGFDSSGYVRGELAFGPARLLGGVAGGRASFGAWIAGEGGAGFTLSRRLDAAARYRIELFDHVAGTGPARTSTIVADAHYSISTMIDAGASALISAGGGRDGVALLGTVVWRPLP